MCHEKADDAPLIQPLDDVLLGRIAIREAKVTPEQIEECVRIQDRQARDDNVKSITPLGEILLECKVLSREELDRLLKFQEEALQKHVEYARDSRQQKFFGKIVRRRGLVTEEQLNDALRLQAKMLEENKFPLRLGEIMVRRGILTREQVQEVLLEQTKTILVCEGCTAQFNVIGVQDDIIYLCYKCGAFLQRPELLQSVRADETHPEIELRQPGEEGASSPEPQS